MLFPKREAEIHFSEQEGPPAWVASWREACMFTRNWGQKHFFRQEKHREVIPVEFCGSPVLNRTLAKISPGPFSAQFQA